VFLPSSKEKKLDVSRKRSSRRSAGGALTEEQAGNPSGSCVEIAGLPDGEIAVRNSRYPSGPALIYTRAEIATFLARAKAGEFEDLA
jgi:hypothetical protein